MGVWVLFSLIVVLVEPMAFEQPHLKEGLLLTLAPLLLARSAWSGSLARASMEALPRPLVALAMLFGLMLVWTGLDPTNVPEAIRDTSLLFVLLLCALSTYADSWETPMRLPRVVLVLGAGVGALALAQKGGLDLPFEDLANENAAVATFGNTNLTGEFLAPIVAMAAVITVGSAARERWLATVALALATGGVVASASRGALVAAIAGLLAAVLASRGVLERSVLSTRVLGAMVIGFALAIGAGGVGVLGFKAIEDAESTIASTEYPTNKQRLLLAAASAEMVRDARWFGHGPGSFRSDFPPFRDPNEAAIVTLGGAPSEAEDPHNQYLLWATEGGFVALLLFLAFLLPALLSFRHAVVLPADDARRTVGPALAAALAAAAVGMLFRSSLAHAPSAMLIFLLAGALLPYGGGAGGKGATRGGTWLARAVPLYLVAVFIVGVPALLGDVFLAQGARARKMALDKGDPRYEASSDEWLALARSIDDANLDLMQFSAARLELGAAESLEMRAEAKDVRRRILERYPFHRTSLLRLAALKLLDEEVESARRLLAVALRVRRIDDPKDPVRLLAASDLELSAVRLLIDDVDRGRSTLDDLRAHAADAEESGNLPAAAISLAAVVRFRWSDADSAFHAAELFRQLGRDDYADQLFADAQLAYGIVHLGGRDHAAAIRAAESADRHRKTLKADVLAALARYADGDREPFEALRERARAKLDPRFVLALRVAEANAAVRAAIRDLAGEKG